MISPTFRRWSSLSPLAVAPLAVRLKWPNDLVVDDRKLGGVLMELRAEGAGPAYVVIGIGINCAQSPSRI